MLYDSPDGLNHPPNMLYPKTLGDKVVYVELRVDTTMGQRIHRLNHPFVIDPLREWVIGRRWLRCMRDQFSRENTTNILFKYK